MHEDLRQNVCVFVSVFAQVHTLKQKCVCSVEQIIERSFKTGTCSLPEDESLEITEQPNVSGVSADPPPLSPFAAHKHARVNHIRMLITARNQKKRFQFQV